MTLLRNAMLLLVPLIALALCNPCDAKWVEDPSAAVPMRDGVILRAVVLRPLGPGPFPVLVYRTPYGAQLALKEYQTFQHALERGYALVVQDVRGRYASQGVFAPYQNEAHDGYDTIEWAAAQPWSNGKIGTFGLSYPGAVQWLAAVENPPHLKAMVPAMTFSSYRNFFFAGGTFDMSWIQWIWNDIAPDIRVQRNLPGPKSDEEASTSWDRDGLKMQSVLPLQGMDSLQGIAPYYYEWLRHPVEDPWWSWAELSGKYGRTQAAILNLTGWYDDNYGPEGATTNFRGLVAARGGVPNNTALLIGPWVHGVAATGKAVAGERRFSDNAAIDYDRTILDWMDHYLRGADNGLAKHPPVRYYVMGADRWQESAVWPPRSRPTKFFLVHAAPGKPGLLSSGKPARLAQSRPASDAVSTSAFSSFVSDPTHPVMNKYTASGAHDYRELVSRTDLLTFDSAPLEQDTELTGAIDSHIFVSCDCRDMDVWVRMYDVGPDGGAWNVMNPGTDVQRASYRNLANGRQLLQPGQIYPIDLKGPVTSNVFKRGHRIRVQISGTFFPNFSRNLQSGDLESNAANSRQATIRIYHEPSHASHIVLPVVEH